MIHRRPTWLLAAVLVALLVAACSSGGATTAPSAAAPSAASQAAGRRGRQPDGLRCRLAEGRPRQGEDRLRSGEPGHDAHGLDRQLVDPRDPDRAGRTGRRLPVGRHHEPAEARRRRLRQRHADRLRGQQADRRHADRQPGWPDLARWTSRRAASRSSPRATTCRSPSTRRSSSRTSPSSRATRPDFVDAVQRQHRVQGGQRQGARREDRARRGRRGHRLRDGRRRLAQGQDARRSRRRQRPGDLRRRRRQGIPERRMPPRSS